MCTYIILTYFLLIFIVLCMCIILHVHVSEMMYIYVYCINLVMYIIHACTRFNCLGINDGAHLYENVTS